MLEVKGQVHSRPSTWKGHPHRHWGVRVHLLINYNFVKLAFFSELLETGFILAGYHKKKSFCTTEHPNNGVKEWMETQCTDFQQEKSLTGSHPFIAHQMTQRDGINGSFL